MFRFGRFGGERFRNKTKNTPVENDQIVEADTSKEWLEKHQTNDDDELEHQRGHKKEVLEKETGRRAVRRSMWDLPDWYK